MIPAWLAYFDALIAIVLVAVGILGAHFGALAPLFGFQLYLLGFFIAILGLIVSIIALLATGLSPKRRRGLPRAIFAVIVCLIIVVPTVGIIVNKHKYPPINDITTDTQKAPEFVHAQQLPGNLHRNMIYDAAKYAAVQIKGYGPVEPLKINEPSNVTFQKVDIIAGEVPHWRLTYTNPKTRTIEGVATSNLFRFKDDFVIQVRPADAIAGAKPTVVSTAGPTADAGAAAAPEGAASLVEMRSKSRVGIGDLGVNYNRIQSFFRILKVHLHGVSPKTVPGASG
ncbi:MAG: DUF1499 domain-containing protein [Candidatus Binataceae bacterium]